MQADVGVSGSIVPVNHYFRYLEFIMKTKFKESK